MTLHWVRPSSTTTTRSPGFAVGRCVLRDHYGESNVSISGNTYDVYTSYPPLAAQLLMDCVAGTSAIILLCLYISFVLYHVLTIF